MIRQVTCSSCGDMLDEYSETERGKLGPCCAELPRTWTRDRETGLYGVSRPGSSPVLDEDDEDDEDEQQYPDHACQSCGGIEFALRTVAYERHYRTYISSSHDEDGLLFESGNWINSDCDGTDDENARQIECSGCGAAYHGDWGWS